MLKRNYGLFTAITMIIGIVIGSGIFFKSDDVLSYTNGNVLLGVGIFCIAAVAIIFGSLAVSQLATRTDKPGGLVTYAEEFVGLRTSCAFGWFYTILYLPALAAVVAWITGMYVCQLFGWESSVGTWTLIGGIVIVILFIVNTLSAKLGGWFQNAGMIIKLIPLVALAVFGLIFGDTTSIISQDTQTFASTVSSFGWIAAFGPIAFSFDGWIIATTICHEIKDSKRNLPLALTFAPIAVLIIYVAYFVGMTSLVGPENVLAQGNDSVFTAVNMLFGGFGAKLILVFVTVSVVGTVNGIILGLIRMPYSMALRNMLPGSKWLSKSTEKLGGMPVNSAIVAFVLSMFWLVVNHITQSAGMRGDVSEIAICISYLNYIVLYVAVMRLAKKGEIKSKFFGYVVPSLAILGSLFILSGSITHPLFVYYVLICAVVMGVGFFYGTKSHVGQIES
ncbi:MAG: APC family permease [Ruthenibacterium sp.]